MAFARRGAHCILTHRWGSADEDRIKAQFRAVGGAEPLIVEADAGNENDTTALLELIRTRHAGIDTVVCGVAFAQVVRSLDDYSRRGLTRGIDYTAWPLVELTRGIHTVFGRYPRYVIGLSSGGPDQFYSNYDFAAAAKSVLETLCRYLAYRLRRENVCVNVVRARFVKTDSLRATIGDQFIPFVDAYDQSLFVTTDEVANAVLALASGWMDAVRGQVLTIDRGAAFSDNLMRMYEQRATHRVGLNQEDSDDQK
jgi:enoyl-[acyl-carrier-protein] reductase (NADH)